MGSEERVQRMRQVLERRIGWVRCALEAVYHRHNVSAVLRSADAMGLHHAHLVERQFHAAKGAARGGERWLDLSLHPDTPHAIGAIRAAGCRIYVADFGEGALLPEEIPLDRPVCLWMGSEVIGVGEEARAAADGVVTIPMLGFAQSLNVSVAAGIVIRTLAERARREIGERALLDAAEKERTWERWMADEVQLEVGVARRSKLRFDEG